MRCLKCNAQWNIGNKKVTFYDSCPICDADYAGNPELREFSSIEEFLQTLIIDKGNDICLETNMINAYLNDYFPVKAAERSDINILLLSGLGGVVKDVLDGKLALVDWFAKIKDIGTSTPRPIIIGILNRLSGIEKNSGSDFGSCDYYLDQYGNINDDSKLLALNKALICDKNDQRVLNLLAKHNLVNGDSKQAIKYLEQSASTGDVEAIYLLADYYLKGVKVKKDKKKAEEYLNTALSRGDQNAIFKLGLLHMTPPDVDLNKATDYFLKAASSGRAEANYMLYTLIYKYTDSKNDAITYLLRAVQQNYTPAIYDYSIHLLYGDDVSENVNYAIQLLDSIASKGHQDAIDKLHYMYYTGFKVAKNKEKANTYRSMKGA